MDYQEYRRDRCWCDCHRLSNIAPADPPLRTDPIAAVWACKRCEDNHTPAIMYHPPTPPAEPYVDPPRPAEAAGQGDDDAN